MSKFNMVELLQFAYAIWNENKTNRKQGRIIIIHKHNKWIDFE